MFPSSAQTQAGSANPDSCWCSAAVPAAMRARARMGLTGDTSEGGGSRGQGKEATSSQPSTVGALSRGIPRDTRTAPVWHPAPSALGTSELLGQSPAGCAVQTLPGVGQLRRVPGAPWLCSPRVNRSTHFPRSATAHLNSDGRLIILVSDS